MADRREKYNALPDKLKQVDAAIRELCEVITGGTFDPEKVWGQNAQENINDYMTTLAVDAGLKSKVNDLLGGLPGGSAVGSAIQAVTKGLGDVVNEIQSTANELGGELSSRLQAFKALNDPHAPSTYTSAPYGLFPAVAGVINAAGSTNIKTDSVMGPLNNIVNVANAGAAISDFVSYANGAIALLGEALKVA